jgi:fermentation-respiration switch protein FrsA (DUF1100 family)
LRVGLKQELMENLPWLVIAYVLICIGGYFANRIFMYFPDPYRYTPEEVGLTGVEEVELTTPDGVTLVAWYAPAAEGRPTVLYFQGNAGNAAGRAAKIETMRSGGTGVFYLNNRGYGGSGGKPTEKKNIADAILAYDHLAGLGIPPDRIVLFGESLGSGQAIPLAAQRPVKAVILEAPLTSTIDVARSVYFWLPLRLILQDRYHNEKNVKAVTAPLLVLHGKGDAVIPVSMGQRVFEAANEPKKLELFPQAGHADLFEHGAWERVKAFLETLDR